MIGLDTVLFTRKGFKKLKDIELYDEVLTPYGVFEPIMKMTRIEDVDYYIQTSTDEIITCSDDLELPVYNKNGTERMICVSCIEDNECFTTRSLPYESKTIVRKNLYEMGAKIPERIDNHLFTISSLFRYELLCGLMDTPMCELKSETGVYAFKPHSKEFENDLVALCRLFGFPVHCKVVKNHRIVEMGVQNIGIIKDIPIRDRYKDISKMPPNNRPTFMPIRGHGRLDEPVKGRQIEVIGNFVLAGYSLIPVKCQIL